MELRDLEYFAVVAEHGHLGRAGEALGLSTAALSKSLRRIEDSMGAKVVRRTPKGVELTTVGVALFRHAKRLRLSFDDVAREAADLRDGRAGELRVGASPGLAEYLMPAASSVLFKAAPKTTLTVTVATNTVTLPALSSGELDMIVGFNPRGMGEGMVHEHLYDDDVIVFASIDHPLARKKRVRLAEVAHERWALASLDALPSRWLREAFEERGLPSPEVALYSNSMWVRLLAVESSDLLGVSAKRVFEHVKARARLVELPVAELTGVWHVGVKYRKDGYFSPAARRFIEILRATVRETSHDR